LHMEVLAMGRGCRAPMGRKILLVVMATGLRGSKGFLRKSPACPHACIENELAQVTGEERVIRCRATRRM